MIKLELTCFANICVPQLQNKPFNFTVFRVHLVSMRNASDTLTTWLMLADLGLKGSTLLKILFGNQLHHSNQNDLFNSSVQSVIAALEVLKLADFGVAAYDRPRDRPFTELCFRCCHRKATCLSSFHLF